MLRGKDSQHQQIEKTEYLRFKAFMKTFEKKFLLKNIIQKEERSDVMQSFRNESER